MLASTSSCRRTHRRPCSVVIAFGDGKIELPPVTAKGGASGQITARIAGPYMRSRPSRIRQQPRKLIKKSPASGGSPLGVFDELWADYLEAQARLRRSGKSDKACDRATDAVDGIVWRIIDTPAQTFIQLRFKFGVMHTMLEDGFPDGGALAMLESIRDDVARLVRP